MTYEEVSKNIDSILNSTIRHDETLDCDRLGSYDFEWLQLAKKALEKQIPKAKHKYKGFRCVCGKEVAKHQIYCEYCGQKLLDWNEVTV